MNGYELSRIWFDWCFVNPDKIKPNHSALYFFCIEHCNRLGWKDKFGLPTTMAMEALGIKSYNTYKQTLVDLVEWGFIKMIETSKNQYSANIVAISNFNKAVDKALDKALIKHSICSIKKRQSNSESIIQSTSESIDSIDKQLTINNKPLIFTEPKVSVETSKLVYNSVKSEFLIIYKNDYGTDYYFQAKDAKKIKDIIKKVFFKMKERNSVIDFTEQEVIEGVNVFMNAMILVADNWLKSNMSLSNIDSKFNEIYTLIKNNKNGNTKTKSPSKYA